MDNNFNSNFADDFVVKNADINSSEENIEDSDFRMYKFSTFGMDLIIRQLVDMLNEKEIEIPKIQRKYVWNQKIASRFIESILLDLPIPSIFLAKSEEQKFIIVDGLQRLQTLYNYIQKGKIGNKVFKLSMSKDIREEWRGKTFSELSDADQRRIKNKSLHAIIVEQKEPKNVDGLFLIFERINTGGMQLNQQEIRNAIFQCPINDLINELNTNKTWRIMFGTEEPHIRMRDNEMILRFLSLSTFLPNYDKESLSMISLLNRFMLENKNATKEKLSHYARLFNNNISAVSTLFGNDIFRFNFQGSRRTKKFYATIYDAVMLATLYAIEKKNINLVNVDRNLMKSRVENLFNDEQFKNASYAHTTELSSIKLRIARACEILFQINYEN